jgi:hypothetical protein
MARTHARVYTSIWSDDDFLALSPGAQRMFLFLVSQPDLEHSGVIALRERRWSRGSAQITVDDVRGDLDELAKARFVVVDEEAEELLVRSLMRWDGVWKQPNVAKSAAGQIRTVTSEGIREVLRDELVRMDLNGANADVTSLRNALVAELGGPSLDGPPTPSATPSGNSSLNPSGNPSDDPSDSGNANHEVSPSADPSRRAQGKGNGNGGQPQDSPSPIPLAIPLPAGGVPLAAAPDDVVGTNGSGVLTGTLVAVSPLEPELQPEPAPEMETPNQRANRLARFYAALRPISNFPGAAKIIGKALPHCADEVITTALREICADDKTSLTTESLRLAIYGKRSTSSRPQGFIDEAADLQRTIDERRRAG